MHGNITVLFLAANPVDTSRLRFDEEMRSIGEAIESSKLRVRINIEKHAAVRVSDLQKLLLRYEPNIVHFSGHGSRSGEIVLEDENGKSALVRPESLSQMFSL